MSGDLDARVRDVLLHIDPNCERAVWWRICAGVKSELGDAGFDAFDEWSSCGKSYSPSATRSTWRSTSEMGGVNFGTVVDIAKNEGYVPKRGAYKKPTQAELDERAKKYAARKAVHDAEKAQEAADAAVRAKKRWEDAVGRPATIEHSYLKRKGIQPHGLRASKWPVKITVNGVDEVEWLDNVLYLPMFDRKNNIHSLQGITVEGDKLFMFGGVKKGHFYPIGKPKIDPETQQPIFVFAEGFATGASVHEATGHMVFCCFDLGNMVEVVKQVRAAKPDAILIIAADNDTKTDGNPGMTRATAAAIEYGARLAVPSPGDFNDMFLAEGPEAVAAAFEAVKVPIKLFEAPVMASAAVHEAALDGDRRRLQQAENQQLQNLAAGYTVPADMSLDEMVKNCVWLADGEAVAYVGGPCTMFLTFKEFCSLTARSKTEVKSDGTKSPRKGAIANAVLWKGSQERAHVMARTFHAGAGILCADPEGRAAINTWRPTKRWEARANIQPFLDHVDYLFGEEEAGVFLDWAAHIEQRPGELPHYGWLHVAQQHGCGRNWLASVLARVFRGYVAPNLDLGALLDSNFNGELGGRVLAVVDEVRAGGGENSHAYENKLRNMVNPEFRQMNPKFGRQYKEHNACRWLVFSNHLNALPLNDEDRRWRAVVHKAPPRAPAVYEQLYALLADAEFINAVAVFFATRDISKFKPGEKPPMTASKREVVASSKSMDQHSIDQLCKYWPAEVITHEDIATYVTSGESTVFTHAMRRSLEDARAKQFERQIKVDSQPKKMWAIRNADHWMAIKNNDTVRREAQKVRPHGAMRTASAIMAAVTSGEEEAVL